jgi:hypothetical protein
MVARSHWSLLPIGASGFAAPRRGFGAGLRALVLAASVGLTAVAMGSRAIAQEAPAPQPAAGEAAGYTRAVESDQGATIELQVSARTMVPKNPSAPLVKLVGVTHIGDKAYYRALQEYLDAQDLVLYEGVKPPGVDKGGAEAGDETDAQRATRTERRIRMLAMLVERYRRDHKDIPDTIEVMIEGLGGPARKIARGVLNDAWDRPIAYVPAASAPATEGSPAPRRTFDLMSLGADGAPGGEGPAADLRFSDQKPLSKDERSGGGGMQENLARSLGLEFQLAVIDYDRPNWRNSDMSVDQVQKDLAELGASADMLFGMLDGSSVSAKIVNIILAFVRSSPAMAASAKVMLVETMASADAMLQRAGGGNMGALMKVIIEHRNDAVLADLRAALDEKAPRRSIALFYGAGHLPDMRRKLEAMGYTLDESQDRWFTAIRVNAKESGIAPEQIKMVRDMIRRSMPGGPPAADGAAKP